MNVFSTNIELIDWINKKCFHAFLPVIIMIIYKFKMAAIDNNIGLIGMFLAGNETQTQAMVFFAYACF